MGKARSEANGATTLTLTSSLLATHPLDVLAGFGVHGDRVAGNDERGSGDGYAVVEDDRFGQAAGGVGPNRGFGLGHRENDALRRADADGLIVVQPDRISVVFAHKVDEVADDLGLGGGLGAGPRSHKGETTAI